MKTKNYNILEESGKLDENQRTGTLQWNQDELMLIEELEYSRRTDENRRTGKFQKNQEKLKKKRRTRIIRKN